ncbi:MAG: zinc ribbon domain-containing protein [Myxococcota bacterium]
MIQCPACGALAHDGDTTCAHCGARWDADALQPIQPVLHPQPAYGLPPTHDPMRWALGGALLLLGAIATWWLFS